MPSWSTGGVAVFSLTGPATYEPTDYPSGTDGVYAAVTADVDDDGDLDIPLTRTYGSADNVKLL